MSGILDSVVPTQAPTMRSFGANGQMYVADLWTGFNISSDRENQLFAFAKSDRNVAHAETLTNLTEPRKIGSTMTFKAVQVGVRLIKFTQPSTPISKEQMSALKFLLNCANIKLNYGSNDTVIAEFTGLHLTNPIDGIVQDADSTNNVALAMSGAINPAGFIRLPEPIAMQANVNIGGTVRFGENVPSELTSQVNSFGFVLVYSGLKVVNT